MDLEEEERKVGKEVVVAGGGGSDKRFLQEPGVWKWRLLRPCLAVQDGGAGK